MKRRQMLLLFLLIATILPFAVCALGWFAIRKNESRFSRIALAFDCAGNAVLNGDYRETISSRARRRWPRMARFVNWLFNDPGHCAGAVRFTQRETSRGL